MLTDECSIPRLYASGANDQCRCCTQQAPMPIAGAFLALEEDAQNALIQEVAEKLDAYVVGDRLVYPDAVNVVTGRK